MKKFLERDEEVAKKEFGQFHTKITFLTKYAHELTKVHWKKELESTINMT